LVGGLPCGAAAGISWKRSVFTVGIGFGRCISDRAIRDELRERERLTESLLTVLCGAADCAKAAAEHKNASRVIDAKRVVHIGSVPDEWVISAILC